MRQCNEDQRNIYQIVQMQEQQSSITKKLLAPQGILVTAVTWNLFGSLPPHNNLVELATSSSFSPKPHIIFFATQQCERDLWVTLCCEAKDRWEAMLRQVFPDYELKAAEAMRGMHSACLVLKKYREDAKMYRVNRLKTGASGCMGTKGALSLVLTFLGQLLQFINCHLPSGQEQSMARNMTIENILQNIVQKQVSCDIIFAGDFNYRIDITNQQYQKMLMGKTQNTQSQMNYLSLLNKDQLRKQRDLKQKFLTSFEEGDIEFPPTYKLDLFSETYSRNRIPGWTDRIFHKTSSSLKRISYTCEYEARGCDHRPVLACFSKSTGGSAFNVVREVNNTLCQLI